MFTKKKAPETKQEDRKVNKIALYDANKFEIRMLKSNTTLPVGLAIALAFIQGLFVGNIDTSKDVHWYDIVFLVVGYLFFIAITVITYKLVGSSIDVAESSGQMEGLRKAKQALSEARDEAVNERRKEAREQTKKTFGKKEATKTSKK